MGKTTCSSAYSLSLARRGYKTLVLSTDPAHSLGQIFQVELGMRQNLIQTSTV